MTKEEMKQEWILILIGNEDIDNLKKEIKNINLNYTNEIGATPLMTALKTNNIEILNLLIAHGADVNQLVTPNHYNLLTYLPITNHNPSVELIKTLSNLGLKPYQEDYKNSALHFALCNGNIQLAEKLIQVGANINEIDKEKTPIIYKVVKRGINASINFLLKNQACLDFKDSNHLLLIDIALQKGELKLAKKLFLHGAPFKGINESKLPKEHLNKAYEFQSFIEKNHLENTVNSINRATHRIKI